MSLVTDWLRGSMLRWPSRLALRMMHELLVTAGNHLHAAAFLVRLGQRDPHGDLLHRVEPEVRCILVPADVGRIVRGLDPHGQRVDEDVGPDEALDGIEDRGMPRERVDPRKEQMRFRAVLADRERPVARLALFELAAQSQCLFA